MSYGTHTLWDIYVFGLHPVCGTAVLSIAVVIFVAGVRDHRERKQFWVSTIVATVLLGFCAGEWGREAIRLRYFEPGAGFVDPGMMNEWLIRSSRSRMMFMAQAGLAIALALGLLWWPIRTRKLASV